MPCLAGAAQGVQGGGSLAGKDCLPASSTMSSFLFFCSAPGCGRDSGLVFRRVWLAGCSPRFGVFLAMVGCLLASPMLRHAQEESGRMSPPSLLRFPYALEFGAPALRVHVKTNRKSA